MAEATKPSPKGRTQLDVLHRALRVHQWAKNLLVFVPLVLGGKAGDVQAWILALAGFISLCLMASSGYLINDLKDLLHDQQHWSKRLRPLASGELSVRNAAVVATIGIVVGSALAIWVCTAALFALLIYFGLTSAYSLYFKRVPIVDVFILACLFTFRLGFGILLTGVRLSPWLLIFSMFVFLSLALAKRHTEMTNPKAQGLDRMRGRGYLPLDLPIILALGIGAALGSILIAILYLIEDAFPRNFYSSPYFLWASPPLLFLFLSRIWLLSQRGQMRDDPVEFALKDKVSLLLGLLFGLVFVAAVY